MSTHKWIDRICSIGIVIALIITVVMYNAEAIGIEELGSVGGYEKKLFDTSYVHTINIVMDDWDDFIDTCENEEYSACLVVIDNDAYKNVGIRAKGNTSLSSVAEYGNDRYSFKIEFDKYDSSKSYYGLDKISLNNIIQDNTYMKDYLTYQMMGYFGVSSSLCSYVYITVNGEDWGLYLAVEGVEESFLERNYGSDYGELYKPDSMSMGGGRGNGDGFNMEDMEDFENSTGKPDNEDANSADDSEVSMPDFGDVPEGETVPGGGNMLEGGMMPGGGDMPEEGMMPGGGNMPEGGMMPGGGSMPGGIPTQGAGGFGGMGSNDVSLIYSDDEFDSYSNIFDNAKTKVSDADKTRLIEALRSMNEGTDIESCVDVEAVIRYFVVHNFVCNFDSYTGSMIHNYYLYEEDGQLSMIPWDYNLAFGGFMSGSDAESLVNYPIDTPVSGGTVDSRPMLAWIFNSDEYTELYHQYFAELIAEYFESGYFETMIDSVTEMISPYVEKDPTKFCTYEEFKTGISTLKEFCLLRAESVSGQLNGSIPSTSEQQGEDSEYLIEASNINISDMGSMGNTMGGGRGMARNSDGETDEETISAFGDQSQNEKFKNFERQSQDMMSPSQDNTETWILLGVSCILLLIGIMAAYKFKR